MAQVERRRKSFSKFKKARPKAVSVAEETLVETRTFEPGTTMPLVVEPKNDDVDVIDWAAANREFLEGKLLEHGALLFRGFGVGSVAEFENLCQAICPHLYGGYGDLPKNDQGENVYEVTPYPPSKTILFHNESSHMARWPTRQFFFCEVPAEEGGETPIVDCRRIYEAMPARIRDAFEEKGLLYVRNFIEGLDVSWQEFFHTDRREDVERHCRESSFDLEWIGENDLRVKQHALGVTRHPKTDEKVFFNQVQLHHVAALDDDLRESMGALFDRDQFPRNVYYGDGSPILDEDVREIIRIYWDLAVAFQWQPGDVVMVDNMLVSHARNPYRGERKMAVALGAMYPA